MAVQEAKLTLTGTLAVEEASPYLAHVIPVEECCCGQQGMHVS